MSHTFLQPAGRPEYQWGTRLRTEGNINSVTRMRVRPPLESSGWRGNIDAAARVSAALTENAVRHGKTFHDGQIAIRLFCPQDTGELFIEVDDASHIFARFDDVTSTIRGSRGTGLWWVYHYRGHLAWRIKKSSEGMPSGKTVQAVLPDSW